MTVFHTVCTKRHRDQHGEDAEMELWDYNWLTWLTGLVALRNNPKVQEVILVTDARGERCVNSLGFTPYYNRVLPILEHIVPRNLNSEVFWAAGKLYAAREMADIAQKSWYTISLDWDCIPWTLPVPTDRICCLNLEQLDLPWYSECREKYGHMVPGEVDWTAPPANNGMIGFADTADMLYYSEMSISFMERLNETLTPPIYKYGDAMTFSEQQMLAIAAKQLGTTVRPLLEATPEGFLKSNPYMTHLWATKSMYESFPEARHHYIRQLLRYLYVHADSDTMALVGNKGMLEVDWHSELPALTPTEAASRATAFWPNKVDVVKSVEGAVWCFDRNVRAARMLREGSVILPGDTVVPESSRAAVKLFEG